MGEVNVHTTLETISIEEMSEQLLAVLERAAGGEEIVITREGQEIARLTPPQPSRSSVPNLAEFRASIQIKGETPMQALLHLREEAR
jgi:antitoxin (DNA-binding transcriptional repressor) of toxin-antitoxin stability system